MTRRQNLSLIGGVMGLCFVGGGFALTGEAQTSEIPEPRVSPAAAPSLPPSSIAASPQYVLRQGDVVQIRVYQEDDLTTVSRIGRDGTITMPLLGSVTVVSNSVEAATSMIRDRLAKDYLVNPQVTVNITEFAKRRFTVMGQVQHPGTFEMPVDDSVSLLQAIATAGGYTRIGNPRKITVARTVGKQKKVLQMDAEALAADKTQKPFEVLADDVIVVWEKWL